MSEKTKALRDNGGKIQLSMVPPSLSEHVAQVLMFGAKKYDRDNWRKGFNWTSVCDSLERHLSAWKKGEDFDQESGLLHLAHIGCNVAFLIEFYETTNGVDDRYKLTHEGTTKQ